MKHCKTNAVKFIAFQVFTLCCLLASTQVFAQTSLFLTSGFEFTGLPYTYKFQQQGNILSRGWAFKDGTTDGGLGLSGNLGLHYRLSDRIGLETGIQYSEMDLIVNDNRFLKDTGIKGSEPLNNISGTEADHGNFDAANWYRSHYIAGYYFFPSRSRTNLYLSGGIAINYLTGPLNMTGTYHSESTNETLQLTTHYKPIYLNSFIESGLCFNSNRELAGRKPIYFLSFKYYFAKDLLTGDYQRIQNGNVIYTDHVDSSGSYLSFNFKIGGLLKSGIAPVASNHYSPRNHHPEHTRHHLKAAHARRNTPRKAHRKKDQPLHLPKIDHSNTLGF